MCKYVLLTMAPGSDVRGITEATRWLDPTPVDNDTLVRALRLGERPYRATSFMCDCGVPVGAAGAHATWPADPVKEAGRWLEQLRAALPFTRDRRVGVFHHEFRTRPEVEGFTRLARREVSADELDAATLLELPADCVLEVVG